LGADCSPSSPFHLLPAAPTDAEHDRGLALHLLNYLGLRTVAADANLLRLLVVPCGASSPQSAILRTQTPSFSEDS